MPIFFTCCRQCQEFFTCQTKWGRSAKNKESICCQKCSNFKACERVSQRIGDMAGEVKG